MKKILLLYAILVVAFLLLAVIGFGRDIPFVPDFGFGNNNGNNQPPASTSATTSINGTTINLLVADNEAERSMGLSGRDLLPQDQGMVFIFEEKGIYSFWMKDMKFPIDIIFINDNKVTNIYKNVPPPIESDSNLEHYRPSEQINYVLELNAGKSDELGIEVGTTIEFEGL